LQLLLSNAGANFCRPIQSKYCIYWTYYSNCRYRRNSIIILSILKTVINVYIFISMTHAFVGLLRHA